MPTTVLIDLKFGPIFSTAIDLVTGDITATFKTVNAPILMLTGRAGLSILILDTGIILRLSMLVFLVPFMLLFLASPGLESLPGGVFLSLLINNISLNDRCITTHCVKTRSPTVVKDVLSVVIVIICNGLATSGRRGTEGDALGKLRMLGT